MRYLRVILVFFYIVNAQIFSQEIPNVFLENKIYSMLIDAGENWDMNTTLGDVRYPNNLKTNLKKDSLYVKLRFGINTKGKSYAIYPFAHFIYQKNLYGYLFSRIVNNSKDFEGYTGIPRSISRAGFNSGETDLSGIGYENNWAFFQLGRGREVWGSGNGIQLLLSNDSPSYDYFMFGSDYGKIKVKYIHGFLESTSDNVNRYITSRGLEWSNKRTYLISISEVVIYSGFNRPIDFGYMNPISSHLEIELNNRLNVNGIEEDGSANGAWQISLDKLYNKNLRISLNLILDEFIFDKSEYKSGKGNGEAYSGRISYSPIKKEMALLTIYSSYVKIGTNTFRHSYGPNNFIVRNNPIGFKYGSDCKEIKFGINFFSRKSLIIKSEFGVRSIGENSLVFNPYKRYQDYFRGTFPSGNVLVTNFSNFDIEYWWKKNILLKSFFKIESPNEVSLKFGIDIYFPYKTVL